MDHGLGIVPQQIPLDEPTNQMNLESKFELLSAVGQIQQTRHHHTVVN
jgi:ABC-type cobalamin/Fe3+-siderophores transport system ATPase subunit